VTKSIAKHLRLYREQRPEALRPEIDRVASLPLLLAAFREVTGWSLQCRRGPKPIHPTESTWSAPVDPGVGDPPGHVTLDPVRSASAASQSPGAPKAVRRLASALSGLVDELLETRHALWLSEAELATGVPVVARPEERKHLAARLQAVLRGGADAVGCHAAALYLLDEATTLLRLRSSWGLPPQRLADPPRPLPTALADLEAMLGHVVVLEDTGLFQQWNPPEDFPAAACVPVASPTTILGTLWVFCNARRDFNDRETNVLEMVAGRLAADLEREMLLREGVNAAQLKQELAAAERVRLGQIPSVPPLLEGWEVAGGTGPDSRLAGNLFDWFSLPDGRLAIALAAASGTGIEAVLSATTVRTALRSHAPYHRDPDTLLQQVNATVWQGSVGDQSAAVACGFLEAKDDRVRYTCAGKINVLHLRTADWQSLATPSVDLGKESETPFCLSQRRVAPGEALVVYHQGSGIADLGEQRLTHRDGLAETLSGRLSLPAKQLAALARGWFDANPPHMPHRSWTVLVAKRTDS